MRIKANMLQYDILSNLRTSPESTSLETRQMAKFSCP